MIYDLIVVGGGPAGLMAAKTAAEDGLKVLLIERKKVITEIDRADSQVVCISFNPIFDILTEQKKYGYLEPISLVINTYRTTVEFTALGFSIDYNGPLRPYFSWICHSPSGYRIYKEKDRFYGFWWSKEALLSSLLTEAEKVGVEILTSTIALGAENTQDSVKVNIQKKSGVQTLEAKRVVAADGWHSKIVASLGIIKDRPTTSGGKSNLVSKVIAYVLEGVETDYRFNALLDFTIPSLNRSGPVNLAMWEGDTYELITGTVDNTSPGEILNRFMKLPAFASWFRNARIVDKKAYGGPLGIQQTLIREPAVGNVLIISDATGLETSNPGAIACGYQAAKATLKELNGQKGYSEYTTWFQKSFEGLDPTYQKAIARYLVQQRVCSDDDVDYLYSLFHDQKGFPEILIAQNLERIKDDKPELYQKLKETGISEGLEKQKIDTSDIY